MKQIKPIQIWKNGEVKTASLLVARIINDDLKSTCLFYYTLNEEDTVIESDQEDLSSTIINGQMLTEGNVLMSEEDYLGWDGSNDSAYTFVANQINVIIV
jgi:hypothetical protein